MATPTVALVLRTSKARPSGEAPVWVRVTHRRRSTFFTATGVAVRASDWNDRKRRVRASEPLADAYNARLDDLMAKARAAALSAESAGDVLAVLDGSAGGSLSARLDAHLEKLDRTGKFEDAKKYRATRKKLEGALGWPLTWRDLSPAGLDRLDEWMRAAGNATNTRRKDLERLRRLARIAVREGSLEPADDPFLRYRLPRSTEVSRRRLTAEEVGELLALGEDDGVADGSRLAAVRDLFAVQFYGAGVRVSDALRLSPEAVEDGRLQYRMLKTGRYQSVRVPPPLAPIVDRLVASVDARDERARRRYGRYLVPFLKPGDDADPVNLRKRIASATAAANKLLKELADLAGVRRDGLSTHVARHTFADLARQKGDLYAVSKALGHANLQMTQTYLASFDRDAVDRLTDSMWNDEA